MTEFIVNLFIKKEDRGKRGAYGIAAGKAGIVFNVFLFIIKIITGLISSSIGIIADALNNLSDAGSSIITLIGFKMAEKPADKDHPFGHGRIEYISAVFVSVIILVMGITLAKSSVSKIFTPEEINVSAGSIIILIVAIMVKTGMYFFNRNIGGKIGSPTLMATAKDSLSDAVATIAVLIGIIVYFVFKINIDGITGLIVSCFILMAGYGAAKEAVEPLLGTPPDKEMVAKIKSLVMSYEVSEGIHDMIIHNYGPGRFMISMHVEVPGDGDIMKMHDAIDLIERRVSEEFNCITTIHMDPIETKNETITAAKEAVILAVKRVDESLSIHDFRMVSGDTHTNLIFDVLMPDRCALNESELKEKIATEVKKINGEYRTVIHVDRDFT